MTRRTISALLILAFAAGTVPAQQPVGTDPQYGESAPVAGVRIKELVRLADRLDAFEWPENIRMVHCEATVEARYEALTDIIAELTLQ